MKQKYAESLTKIDNHLPLSFTNLVAYKNAVIGLDSLTVNIDGKDGIYAGIPWFFHFWARDEAISCGALICEEQFELTKKILVRLLGLSEFLDAKPGRGRKKKKADDLVNEISNYKYDRISNRFPSAGLATAHGSGWAYLRLHQLLRKLSERNEVGKYFTDQELLVIYETGIHRLKNIEAKYLKSGLIENAPLETWMDTGAETNDVRSGFRIEIQALHIAMYDSIIFLGDLIDEQTSLLAASRAIFRNTLRQKFFDPPTVQLFDGTGDPTIRPNTFIAAYVAPDILTKKEWGMYFDKVLPILLKEMRSNLKHSYKHGEVSHEEKDHESKVGVAGLLTIPENHPLYCSYHTGQNNHSYHRGDIWYYLNSLAAIVLKRNNEAKYKREISLLVNATKDEMLWHGAVGCSAEISSAEELTSLGCLSQAWSYAMFIEYCHEKRL